jgi:hypothetical protein
MMVGFCNYEQFLANIPRLGCFLKRYQLDPWLVKLSLLVQTMTNTRHNHFYSVYVISALIAIFALISYFVPAASGVYLEHTTAHHVRLTLTVIMTVSFYGSAYLLLKGVGLFKSTLRAAYRWFAIGNILFGFAMLQWPIIVIGGWEFSFWAVSGVVVIPFLLATLLMYIGMRRFALLLGVRSIITSRLWSTVVVFVFAAASAVVAHFVASNNTSGIETETYTATVAWSTGYGLLAWLLVRKTARRIGASYRRAMSALLWALGLLTFSGLHEYVTSYFLTERVAYVYWGGTLWPFILASFLFIWAGYEMGLTKYAVVQDQPTDNSTDDDRAFVESVTGTAELASRPEDIDRTLDGLRAITANIGTGGVQLTETQRAELVQVYERLEEYLIASDPLRSFTREELRGRLAPGFSQRVEHTYPLKPPDLVE